MNTHIKPEGPSKGPSKDLFKDPGISSTASSIVSSIVVLLLFLSSWVWVEVFHFSVLAFFAIVGVFFISLILTIVTLIFVSGELDDYHRNKTK
jgi:hypothetical protein